MPKLDFYKSLGAAVTVTLPMEQIVRECISLDYGAHQLLSAMVHAMREKNAKYCYGPSPLADGIEKLLNDGLYN